MEAVSPDRPSLLFVDDDVDLQDTVQDAVRLIGIDRVVTVGSLAELERRHADALSCSLAILDINLGADLPSGIDVHRWLMNARYAGAVAFLTGHGADDPRVQQAAQ